MSDLPIIFSAPMVRGLVREVEHPGTGKTQTRRLAWRDRPSWFARDERVPAGTKVTDGHSGGFDVWRPSPWQRVRPGDRLWVRENLCAMGNWGLWHDAGPVPSQGRFLDDLDERGRAILERYAPAEATDSALVPSIHMPRWASRLTLVVTATKIERLNSISEADCIAEGITHAEEPANFWTDGLSTVSSTPRGAFGGLWEHLHGTGSWSQNPEVVALTFKVHRCNIDDQAMLEGER